MQRSKSSLGSVRNAASLQEIGNWFDMWFWVVDSPVISATSLSSM
jgi:hypothetical protein